MEVSLAPQNIQSVVKHFNIEWQHLVLNAQITPTYNSGVGKYL